LGGPNGAGKSTAAPAILRDFLGIRTFVNADVIARGLSGFAPDDPAIEAGRIMVARIRDLAERRESFAFETTLAARSPASLLRGMTARGYRFELAFLWLPSADLAVERVRQRVAKGGHDVPEETIRRRYRLGLRNLVNLYVPIASRWRVLDGSDRMDLREIAKGESGRVAAVCDPVTWSAITRGADAAD
jgi:predicted ABC-type ATPase